MKDHSKKTLKLQNACSISPYQLRLMLRHLINDLLKSYKCSNGPKIQNTINAKKARINDERVRAWIFTTELTAHSHSCYQTDQ